MNKDLIQQFETELKLKLDQMKREKVHNPHVFLRMAYEDGFYITTKRVIIKSQNTSGFSDLLIKGRTDLSVEDLVIDDRYQSIFSSIEINLCKERLGVIE